ncbi:MAG: ECF transporter S component [Erysipelotrichaceae bacterium]|nr:ECF transporter S component [Erysipelotrichaceae bacterium]
MKKYLSIHNIAKIAVLAAIAAVLMIIDVPIFVAPSFYKLDVSDLPCLIGGFSMGGVPCVFIIIIKIILKLLFKPTSTAFVGEMAALVCSLAFCLPASYIYKKNRTKKGAIKAMVISTIIVTVVSCLANYLFIIPAYVNLFHMPLEAIIAAGKEIFPIINNKLDFVLLCVAPFNLIKYILVDILSLVSYKHVSPLLKS